MDIKKIALRVTSIIVAVVTAAAMYGCGTAQNNYNESEASDPINEEIAAPTIYFAPAKDMTTRLWGYIDTTGGWVIEPKFSMANSFNENGLAIVEDPSRELYGLIDTSGEWVLEPMSNQLPDSGSDGEYPLAVAVQDVGGQQGYVSIETGEWILGPGNYMCSDFVNDLARVQTIVGSDGKYGFIDTTGSMVIEPQFTLATDFNKNGFAVAGVGIGENITVGIIDTTGAWVAEPQFPAGGSLFSYTAGGFGDDGYAVFRAPDTKLAGIVNEQGSWMTNADFELIWPTTPDQRTLFDENGLACAMLAGGSREGGAKVGLIDKQGSWVIDPVYEYDYYSDDSRLGYNSIRYANSGLYKVDAATKNYDTTGKHGIDNLWGYIDTSGAWVIEPQFTEAGDFDTASNTAIVCDSATELYGVIDTAGNWLIEPRFASITGFWDGGTTAVAQVPEAEFYGLINTSGEWLIESKYSQMKWSGVDGVVITLIPTRDAYWSLMDDSGEWIVGPHFGDTGIFRPVNVTEVTYWKPAGTSESEDSPSNSSSSASGNDTERFAGVLDGDFSAVSSVYENNEGDRYTLNPDGTILNHATAEEHTILDNIIESEGAYFWMLGHSKGAPPLYCILVPIGVELPNSDVETDTTRIRLAIGSEIHSETQVYYLEE